MKFTLGHHSDVIFEFHNRRSNLGYLSTLSLPALFWLHNIQTEQKNIISEEVLSALQERLGEEKVNPHHESFDELEKVVCASFEIVSECPLPVSEFNSRIRDNPVFNMTNGSFSTEYYCRLEDFGYLALYMQSRETPLDKEKLISLSPSDSRGLLKKYALFAAKEASLGVYRTQIFNLMKKLNDGVKKV